MTLWDDRILEIIREEGSGAPTELSEHDVIQVSRQHVSTRLQKLADHGLLQPLGNGVYVITERGEAYLDGEYDAEAEAYLNGGGATDGPTASETTET
jgi:predicted transcriptional regulator